MSRPTNAETIRANRRRRTDNLGNPTKLAITGKLDTQNFEHRWISDNGARLHQKTVQDDFEIVTQDGDSVKEDASPALGTGVAVRSGVDKDGKPLNLYLCRKPKVLAEDDRNAKEEQRKRLEEQIIKGTNPVPGNEPSKAFYQHSGNRIS